ncbi:hypothetical protein Bb109J_c3067 [Bdellovibrio bacteriovorus]|uniref:amidohydrolase n=1 Tax=Bdellovibrio bacteriovorus TaxID=959 RepID=UPI00045BE940|nr:amidohydrolase family protein [Bdellovibrio bacteriovorus]AHZ83675.1 metal-dependent hydrolase [Bdellovibrio bacteriovorus]BEV69647.1 hypothetical protein Bb109J_c3067 [Bdellovibrio bacteriovorus]
MLFKIPRLYDSHVHFIATGEFASGLRLESITSLQDLQNLDRTKPGYYRQHWLVGFGWDERQWPAHEQPHKDLLDKVFPDIPVYFARMDGHSSWLNTTALKEMGLESATGILTEKDHLRAWDHLPSFSKSQQRANILQACRTFNAAGFTHVRDLSCTESLWNMLCEVADAGDLTLAIEENFTSHDMNDFERMLTLAVETKKQERPLLRSKGIKVFYDGSLGSETALLSRPYNGERSGNQGRILWDLADIEMIMKRTWAAGLEFSVHTIGDEAAHHIVQTARKISAQGAVGRLNLEHAQILRPETIQMMKPLHVRCHMQPCHWLSDRMWLMEKLRELYPYVFPWEALRLAQIPISFGCDSPVEPSSFWRNYLALEESPQARIRKFNGDITVVHAHPDKTFAPDCHSVIEDGVVKEVVFNGKRII